MEMYDQASTFQCLGHWSAGGGEGAATISLALLPPKFSSYIKINKICGSNLFYERTPPPQRASYNSKILAKNLSGPVPMSSLGF